MREEQEQRDKTNVHALLRFVLFHARKTSSYARRVKRFRFHEKFHATR